MPNPYADRSWSSITKSLDAISAPAALLLFTLSALTFVTGYRPASYFILTGAYFFTAATITRWLARNEKRRNLALAVLSAAFFAWLIYNLSQDLRAQRLIVVTPARSGESLVLVSEFERRSTRVSDISKTVRERLDKEIAQAKLRDVRIETLSSSQTRVGDRTAARALGARHQAALVVWGWYDESQVHVDIVVMQDDAAGVDLPRRSDYSTTPVDTAIIFPEGTPDEWTYATAFIAGVLLMRAERLDEARDRLADAEYHANNAKVTSGLDALNYYRAVVLNQLGADLELVIEAYSRAIDLNPQLAPAYYDRAIARAARGDGPEQVFADFAQALDLEPRFIPFAYTGLADLPSPLPHERSRSKLLLGIDAYSTSDYDEALDELNSALADEPAYMTTYYFRARVYHVRREYRAAVEDYTIFLNGSGTIPLRYLAYANYARALAYRALNQRDLAVQEFDAYLRIAPATDPFREYAELYKQR